MSTSQALLSSKNFEKAEKFLNIFNYPVTTLQCKYEKDNWEDVCTTIRQNTELLKPTKKRGIGTYWFKGTKFSKLLQEEIQYLQSHSFSLWYMVNPGDGVVHEPHFTARSQASVTTLAACFVDTDKGNPKKLENFCAKRELHYHIKVETSPGKFHYYFLLNPVPADKDNLLKWEAIQRRLMNLDPLYDGSVCDSSQLLRLPFFYHNKKEPFLIRPEVNLKNPKYTLEDLYEQTEASKFLAMNGQGERFEYPEGKINSGHRHFQMMAYLRHVTNIAPELPPHVLKDIATGFAINRFEDYKPFLPGKERNSEIDHNVQHTVNYVENEKRENAIEKLQEADKKKKEGFYLPPEFFYDCPNKMVGEMVRHSASIAHYPAAAYDFAALVAMFGTLKSHLFISSRGHPPVNYFLCFGASGRGKSHSQALVNRTLSQLGEGGIFGTSLVSEKGLYRGLSEGGSRYMVMMDEVEQLLTNLNSDRAKVEHYQKGLQPALLKLYSEYNKTYKSALTGNVKDTQYVLTNPHLNLIGYSTPTAINKSFNVASLERGFLPRFILVQEDTQRILNEKAQADIKLTSDQMQYIRDVVMAGKCKKEEDFLAIEDLEKERRELEEYEGKLSKAEKRRVEEIGEELIKLKDHGRVIGKAQKVPFSPKAEAEYVKFQKEMDRRYNLAPENPISVLFTRVAEKVGRLCTVLAEKEIDLKLLNWTISYIESQLEHELALCGNDGELLASEMNYEEKQYQRLHKLVEKLSLKTGEVTKRDLSRSMHVGGKLLDALIQIGVDREQIEITKAGKKPSFRPKFEV